MIIAVMLSLIGGAISVLFPLLIVKLLGGVTSVHSYRYLNILAGVLLLIFFVQGAINFVEAYLLAYVGERVVYDLRTKLYRHFQGLSLDFFSGQRVGDLISRISSDVTQMRNALTTGLSMLFSQTLMLIGSLVVLFGMNVKLTVLVLCLFPVMILVVMILSSKIAKISSHIQDKVANSTVIAEEGLHGIQIVKMFGREKYEVMRYVQAVDNAFRPSLRNAVYSNLLNALITFFGFSAVVVLIWYGGREVIAGHLSLAMIIGFLIYGISIAGSVGQLASLYGQISAAVGGVQRVFELLNTRPTVQDRPGATTVSSCLGRITFENVSFSYNEARSVIQDISLDIQAGEILALVGPSGAGKSTIFKLIPRFYDPTVGSVKLDGQDMRCLTQESLRAQMAIVPQETMLFGGAIRENILYGRLDASETEMIEAAKDANAHDFIMSLPLQYDTRVGERGAILSGGQRQRIAIARAILKNPRILLLDEATSALDNESEELVQIALKRLIQNGRTTIIIAHRLSTIKVANRIAVIDDGCITELGTHEELMQLSGLYAKLYSMQFRESMNLFS